MAACVQLLVGADGCMLSVGSMPCIAASAVLLLRKSGQLTTAEELWGLLSKEIWRQQRLNKLLCSSSRISAVLVIHPLHPFIQLLQHLRAHDRSQAIQAKHLHHLTDRGTVARKTVREWCVCLSCISGCTLVQFCILLLRKTEWTIQASADLHTTGPCPALTV